MGTPRAVLAALLAIAALLASAVLAQEPQQPVFRAKVDAVTLDVAVLSKSGAPVTDLKAEDFEITEQGKPQKIETFELVDMAARPPMDSNLYHEIRTMQSQEQELARKDSRIFLILLDDYHVKLEDQWQVRNQLADVVRQIDPRDLVALMYPLMPSNTLTFSRDHEELARQIQKFEGREGVFFPPKGPIEENHIRSGNVEKARRDVVRTALAGICTYLGSLRETRKSLLLVGDWAPGGMGGFALDDYKEVQRAAARSNTAIYTWDPQGLTARRPSDWLITLAQQTGGRATVNTNNGRAGMLRMVADSEAYYQIGYTSTENVHDGKFHDVKVKVKRSGAEVRARPGYWAYDAEALGKAAAPLPPPVDPAVNAALEAAETPEQGRPMLAWAGFDRDASGATMVSVVWEARDTRTPIDHADIIASSGASSSPSYRGRAKSAVTFPAGPGTLSIRIEAAGADESPVETGFLVLTVPPSAGIQIPTPRFIKGRTAKDVMSPAAVPTAWREFTRLDQVAVRAHAWTESGAPATMSARLLSDHGDVLLELTTLADGAFSLPIAGLGLGRYVVEITATDGAASTKVLAAFRKR